MIGLVACSSTKLAVAAPARELYCSPLFKKAAAYAERCCSSWYVLSALHGLVDPDTVLAPYNCTLLRMSKGERSTWGQLVYQQMRVRGIQRASFLMLAGSKYAGPLQGLIQFTCPLAGLGIGKQLQFLSEVDR